MTTAKEMIAMLRRHYLPESKEPGGIFAPEIQAPNSARRADLIWQGCTSASGHELVGHEVKVSRKDVLVELSDPTKSDPWQRYCDRWWLVLSDPALVDGLELPPTWGVLAPPSGRRTRSMTVVVPAPKLNPAENAPALKTLAVWLHWRSYRTESANTRLEEDVQRAQARIRELESELRISGLGRQNPNRKLVAEIVEELDGAYGIADDDRETWSPTVKRGDLVAGLRDLASVQHKRDAALRELKQTRQSLGGLRGRIDRVLREAGVAA
jgi:hypothetical protein